MQKLNQKEDCYWLKIGTMRTGEALEQLFVFFSGVLRKNTKRCLGVLVKKDFSDFSHKCSHSGYETTNNCRIYEKKSIFAKWHEEQFAFG